jgi:shikimate dehydrogenase
MDKNQSPKIYGVLGYPAKHSLSPYMHNEAFKYLNIDAEYKIFEKKPDELSGFLSSLVKEGIGGLNVTVPYKEMVLPFLESISGEAELIGAVNTIKISGKGLEGFNTDGEGFFRHLTEDLRFNPAGKIIAIIGAGGAAKAISIYMSKAAPKRIAVYDIDKPKLSALARHLKDNFKAIDFIMVNSVEELNIKECSLLVNATPVGMKETDACLVNANLIHPDLLVYDLIYNPKQTKLLMLAKEKGASASNGLGMLLYQGARSFEIFTEKKAPIEVMRRALEKAVSKL